MKLPPCPVGLLFESDVLVLEPEALGLELEGLTLVLGGFDLALGGAKFCHLPLGPEICSGAGDGEAAEPPK